MLLKPITLLVLAMPWLAGNSAAFTIQMVADSSSSSRRPWTNTALSSSITADSIDQLRPTRRTSRFGLRKRLGRLFKRRNQQEQEQRAPALAPTANTIINDPLPVPYATQAAPPSFTSSPTLITLNEEEKEEVEDVAQSNKKKDALEMKFVGAQTVVSDPAPLNCGSSLADFFRENRHLLFPNNDAVAWDGPLTVELAKKWTQLAVQGGGSGPDFTTNNNINNNNNNVRLVNSDTTHHQIIKISAPLQMPGLSITSESTIGCRLILSSSNTNMPEYQFTLLDSQLTAKGPAKWLFQQLTKYLAATYSFTRVTAEPPTKTTTTTSSNDDTTIVFRTAARLETRIQLPRAAARVLPVNLARFERQGSQAVQKLLRTELQPALQGFRQAYSNTAAAAELA